MTNELRTSNEPKTKSKAGGKREGAGRPPLNLTAKKNRSIKCTDGEWEAIQTFASLNKMSVSQFIRMACFKVKEDLYND